MTCPHPDAHWQGTCHAFGCGKPPTDRVWFYRRATGSWVGGLDYCDEHSEHVRRNSTVATTAASIRDGSAALFDRGAT